MLGIEIGHKNIKIIYGHKKREFFKLKYHKIIELNDGIINDGFILNQEYLVSVISNFLKTYKIKTKNVAINIQSTTIIRRNIIIPKLKKDELKKFIEFQKQDHFPIDISDYQVDYKINGIIKNDEGEESYEIMLIAVPNKFIEPYINLFKALNLIITNIDTNSDSLAKLFNKEVFCDKDNEIHSIAIIDIGAKTTNITLTSAGNILFCRTVLFGASELTIKNDFIVEINKFIDFYNSKYKDIPITEMYLVGGGAYLKDIDKYMKLIFKMNVILKTTITSITQPIENILYFVSLIGLVTKKPTLGLLPNWYLSELNNKKIRDFIISKTIIMIFIISILTILPNILISQKQELLKVIASEINALKFDEFISTTDRQEWDTENGIINAIKNNSIVSNDTLEIIMKCIPDKIYINEIIIDDTVKHITINGKTDTQNKELVIEFVINLASIKGFINVDFDFLFENNRNNEMLSYTIGFEIIKDGS